MYSARLSFPQTISQRGLVLLMLWSLMVMILRCKPIHDVDTFWHIRVGQLMLDSGRLVTHDQFAYTHAGEPTPSFGWLAQLVFAYVFRIDSWRSLQSVYAVLFSGAFTVAASSSRCAKLSLFSVALAVMLGFGSPKIRGRKSFSCCQPTKIRGRKSFSCCQSDCCYPQPER